MAAATAPTTTFCALADHKRLDAFLAAALAGDACTSAPSRAVLAQLIAAGHVLVEGRRAKTSQAVRRGQQLQLSLPPPVASALTPVAMPLTILYEDASVLVLDKPAHLAVHPGAGSCRPTLVHGLLAHCVDLPGIGGVLRPGIVHRLDANTTGVMVVAKTAHALRQLSAQFAARTVEKHYLALVHAHATTALGAGHGVIDTPFARHARHRHRFSGQQLAAGSPPRRAVTHWRQVASGSVAGPTGPAAMAVVLCRPTTGRTHQIRVHLAEMGCPIAEDHVYGGRAVRRQPRPRKTSAAANALAALDHHALHAWRLTFDHPADGRRLTFTAPLPPSWADVARQMRSTSPQGDTSTPAKEAPCA